MIVAFDPIDKGGGPVSFTSEAGVVPVTPLVRFVALFDRVVDPDSLENADGSAKVGIASAQAGAMVLPLTTNYVPNGDNKFFGTIPAGPTLTVSPPCGFPSGAPIQFSLDLMKIRSHDLATVAALGEGVTSVLTFSTEPFSVTTDVPAPVEPDPVAGTPGGPATLEDSTHPVQVVFSDATPGPMTPEVCAVRPSTKSHIVVTATLGGVPVSPFEAVISQDPGDLSHWTVSPPGTTDADHPPWPAGAIVTVTIDATATDNFGTPLVSATATTASFMVKS